jgi:hypothetical protein
VAHLRLQALGFLVDIPGRALIALGLGEVQQLRGVRDALGGALDLGDVGAQARAFPSELLRAPGIGPDRRLFELPPYFLEAFLLAVVLKETPEGLPCVRLSP